MNQKEQDDIAVQMQSEQDDALSDGRQDYRDGEECTKEVHETVSFGRLHAKRTKSSKNDRQQSIPPQTLELVRGKPVVDGTELVPGAGVDIGGRGVVDVLSEDYTEPGLKMPVDVAVNQIMSDYGQNGPTKD